MILNYFKTALLLSALSGLLMLMGSLMGGSQGVTFALIMSLIFNGITYFFSDKIVLKMYGAKQLAPNEMPDIQNMVTELARELNIPKPKIWIANIPIANAFATGRNPANGSIALTPSIISLLDKNELRGVLAHELGHIKNRDILISTIAATMASAIGYLANMLRYSMFWRSSNDRNRNYNPLLTFIIALLMPIAAIIIQLAVSRSREYGADDTGARCCKDPLALASALEKLNRSTSQAHLDPNNTQQACGASLFIVNPFLARGLQALFMTHPPVEERVKRLRNIHQELLSR